MEGSFLEEKSLLMSKRIFRLLCCPFYSGSSPDKIGNMALRRPQQMHSDESRNKKWMAHKNREKQEGEFGGQTLSMNDVGYDALAASKLYCNLYTYFVVSKSNSAAVYKIPTIPSFAFMHPH